MIPRLANLVEVFLESYSWRKVGIQICPVSMQQHFKQFLNMSWKTHDKRKVSVECYTCVQSDVYYSFPKYHLQVALPVDVFSVVLFLNIPHLKFAVLYRTYASPSLRGGGHPV